MIRGIGTYNLLLFSMQKMARDKCNVFQLTEAQLRRKCMDLQRSSFSYLLEEEDSMIEEEKEEEEGIEN